MVDDDDDDDKHSSLEEILDEMEKKVTVREEREQVDAGGSMDLSYLYYRMSVLKGGSSLHL